MPITRKEFHAGTDGTAYAKAKKLLQNNPDTAYYGNEIAETIEHSRENTYYALRDLVKEKQVKKKKIRSKTYYCWSVVKK